MQRRDFLRNTLALGAAGMLPGGGLASAFPGNLPQDETLPPSDHSDNTDMPPLIRAIRLGRVETVKSLVRQGADINERWGKNGGTPLHYACVPSALEAAKRMHFYDPDLQTHHVEEFYGKRIRHIEASTYSDRVTLLDSAECYWRSKVQYDGSPIYLPGRIARQKIVKFLIDSGADINAKNRWGGTPLILAARTSDVEFLQYLFRLGVDRDARDKYEYDFVCDAAQFSDVHVMRFLVESGIDIHYGNDRGTTLLRCAAQNFDISVMKYLIELGLDPHAKDSREAMPIHTAAWKGNVEAVRYLISLGADVNARNRSGKTPLHEACSTKITRFLIDAGADIEAKYILGGTPLHYAAEHDHLGNVKVLLQAGANLEAVKRNDGFTSEGSTPLNLAMRNGKSEMAEYLFHQGADPSKFTFDADVIFIDSKDVFVALKWDAKKMYVPAIMAKGRGWLGERIRDVALAKDIPIVKQDESVVRDLFDNVNIHGAIPKRHSACIAKILPGVYRHEEVEESFFGGAWIPLTQEEIEALLSTMKTDNA